MREAVWPDDGGDAQGQRPGRHVDLAGDDGSGRHRRPGADHGVVQHHGVRSHQALVFEHAALEVHEMADDAARPPRWSGTPARRGGPCRPGSRCGPRRRSSRSRRAARPPATRWRRAPRVTSPMTAASGWTKAWGSMPWRHVAEGVDGHGPGRYRAPPGDGERRPTVVRGAPLRRSPSVDGGTWRQRGAWREWVLAGAAGSALITLPMTSSRTTT